MPDTMSWGNRALPPIPSQCLLPSQQPPSTSSSSHARYMRPFSGKGLHTLSNACKLREPLQEQPTAAQPPRLPLQLLLLIVSRLPLICSPCPLSRRPAPTGPSSHGELRLSPAPPPHDISREALRAAHRHSREPRATTRQTRKSLRGAPTTKNAKTGTTTLTCESPNWSRESTRWRGS